MSNENTNNFLKPCHHQDKRQRPYMLEQGGIKKHEKNGYNKNVTA